MTQYNLTARQKDLLRTVVEQVLAGAREPLIPVATMRDSSIIGIKGVFSNNLSGDLEILAQVDLLSSRYNSSGNKIYTIMQSGYDAVKNNFEMPKEHKSQVNIGTIIENMNGGNVQGVGLNSESQVNQIINDPQALQEKLDDLAEKLIETVKSELPTKELLTYIQALDELKKQLQSEKPDSSLIAQLFKSISFLGDIESSITLAALVWTHVQPFLLIASQKLINGS